MSNSYILPLCFAAATHGALLFGFTKTPAPVARPVEKIRDLIPFVMRAPEEAPPIVVDAEAAGARPKQPAPEPPPLRGPEPDIMVDTTRPSMNPPPIPTIDRSVVKTVVGPEIGSAIGHGTNPWGRDVISTEFLDNPPRTRLQPAPLYPYQAKREGVSGEVFVDFVVDEEGRVVEPRVTRSTHPMFEEPTLRAVSKWRFEPGRRGGKVVRFRMTIPVMFNLNEGA